MDALNLLETARVVDGSGLLEIVRILGLIVLVWFALVGWKLLLFLRVCRRPAPGPLGRQAAELARRSAHNNLWTH
jgi:hypothetical protein